MIAGQPTERREQKPPWTNPANRPAAPDLPRPTNEADNQTGAPAMAKQQLPPITPEHAAFNKRAAASEDQTARYVIPLDAIDENKERYALDRKSVV